MKRKDPLIGGIISIFGVIMFLLFLILIPAIPFQITQQEQSLLYIFSLFIMFAGIFLMFR